MSYTESTPSRPPGRDHALAHTAPRSVVLIGRDGELLRLFENAIVTRSDLTVHSLAPVQAVDSAHSPVPRLWVFSSGIEIATLVHLASTVRRYSPQSRLLLVRSSPREGFEDHLFHWIGGEDDLDPLLEAISRLAAAA